jgi:hypothetical protein
MRTKTEQEYSEVDSTVIAAAGWDQEADHRPPLPQGRGTAAKAFALLVIPIQTALAGSLVSLATKSTRAH